MFNTNREMKGVGNMLRSTKLLLALTLAMCLCFAIGAQADVFNMGPGIKSLETVTVGDTGNAADAAHGNFGAVGYTYSISKYEITAAQYADFLNHKAQSDPLGLYNSGMAGSIGCGIVQNGASGSYTYTVTSGWENRPVNYVSFWDCCRFANWLYHGQGTGDMETGAYTLNGFNANYGGNILRNSGAGWFVSSSDEWYKAAYYKGGGTNAGYWLYATQSDAQPSNEIVTPDPGNNASYGPIGASTLVGEFENSESFYGTFDQVGNLWEYCDTVVSSGYFRGNYGGSWLNDANYIGPNSYPQGFEPYNEYQHVGFRVVQIGALSPGTISGTVSGASGPLAGATVTITGFTSVTTGTSGTYSIEVPPGTYTVVATKAGYDTVTVPSLVVGVGATVTQNFTLGTQTLQGQVTIDVAGSPISGATVKTADGLYSTTTDTAGNYSMYVPSGSQTIVVTKANYAPVSVSVSITANAVNTRNFALSQGWDFVADWTVVNPPDPNGVWTYGYDVGSGLGLFTHRWDMDPGVSYMVTAALPSHNLGGIFIKNFNSYHIGKNYSGIPMVAVESNAAAIAPPQIVGETPAASGTGIARFTAPTGGYFRVRAAFTAQTYAAPNTNCSVSLVRNGAEDLLPSSSLTGFIGTAVSGFADSVAGNVSVVYDQNIAVASGDQIDAKFVGTGWAGLSFTISTASDAAYVRGTVTSSLGGGPVSAATVTLIGGGNAFSTTTSATGAYTAVVAPNTTYQLRIEKSGFNNYVENGVAVTSGIVTKNAQLQHNGVWSFALDFDTIGNPNNQWAYGYLEGDDSYVQYQNADTGRDYTTNTMSWQHGSSQWELSGIQYGQPGAFVPGHGAIFKWKGVEAGYSGNGNNHYLEAGMAGMLQSFGRPSIRWTAPSDMIAKVSVKASNQTPEVLAGNGWGDPGVKMLRNGNTMFAGKTYGFAGRAVNNFTDSIGPSPIATLETALPIKAGDVFDLQAAVMYGHWPPIAVGVDWQIEPFTGGVEVGSIKQIRDAAVDTTVFLTTPKSLILGTYTLGFKDRTFYIEEDDRSTAIKLLGDESTPDIAVSSTQGYKITLTGKVVLVNGEKVVRVMSINSATPATPVAPLGMTSKALTASNKSVRVWGKLLEKVANTDPATQENWPYLYWTINDGGNNVKIPMIGQRGWMNTPAITDPIAGTCYVGIAGIARLDASGQLVVMPWSESNVVDYTEHL
jgi:formylglycine-generating enzyme required for sulfatase activity